MEYVKPEEIEQESMAIIRGLLAEKRISLPGETAHIVMRVIHTTADFDYAENLIFTGNAATAGAAAFADGCVITDTNMALSGINKGALTAHRCEAYCFMAEPFVAEKARKEETTRAAAAVDYAVSRFPQAIFAIGNAPTALIRLCDHIEAGARPSLVIGVPVGFVNVTESKERALAVCARYGIPAVIAAGSKGGSNVCAAICNALLYGPERTAR